MKRNIYLDYSSISLRLDALSCEIKQEHFDAIVMILRGGFFAGMHMTFLTGLPYYFLRDTRSDHLVDWMGNKPDGRKILLCEDFAGKGQTLIDSRNFLIMEGYDVSTLVVCKDHLSASQPNYFCFENYDTTARFLLPWERSCINPKFHLTPESIDPDFERTAWDMDGIFLHDLESHLWADKESALALRDQYELADFAPAVSPKDVIVTGRPILDKERTEDWLCKHDISVPVYLRDDQIEKPTSETVAKWKGQKALELGCTHYMESDAVQAVHIASLYPELRVFWWNEGRPKAIQASPVMQMNKKLQTT